MPWGGGTWGDGAWGSVGTTWAVDIDPDTLTPGEHTFTITATDTAGNIVTTSLRRFTVLGGTVTPDGVYEHWPTIVVQAAWAAPASGRAPAEEWLTISEASGFATQRGRTSEIEAFSAATATVHIDDADRKYDVDNVDSPYLGILTYNRPFRIVAVWAGVEYSVFYGYADQWGPPKSGALDYAELDITATDAFKRLAGRKITAAVPFVLGDPVCGVLGDARLPGVPTYEEEHRTGDLVNRVLDLIGWPADERSIDAGQTECLPHTPDKAALEYLQQLERTEHGRFFVGADGQLEFHQRRGISRTVQVVASDVALAYPTLTYNDDYQFDPSSRATIKNRVVRTNGQRTVTRQDAPSIATYDLAEDSQDVLTADPEEMDAQCRYLLGKYATPAPRITQITFSPEQDPDYVWPHILGRQIGERIVVIRTPHPDATPVGGYYTIESIGHDVDGAAKRWRCTWGLAPSPEEPGLFTLGTSILGGTDVLAY